MSETPQKQRRRDGMLWWRRLVICLCALLVVIICYVLPTPTGLSQSGQIMIGIMIMGAILWITEPIPLAATGLLIIIMQPMMGTMQAAEVFSSFGNQAIFFLIGAFIIAGAIEKYGLHRRIALRLLTFFSRKPKMLSFGIMMSCVFLSFLVPEHAVAALFLPIVTSILIALKVTPRKSNFGKICMLSVAYGCSIGSLGTLIGGARNPLTITILSNLNPPITVSFFDWMLYSMPVVFISFPLIWGILQLSFPVEPIEMEQAKQEISHQVHTEGKLGRLEVTVIGIVIFTIILWVFFSSHLYYGLAVAALIGSILIFVSGALTWKDVEKRVPWGVILLYGGAITLGIGMQKTGAGSWIAHSLFDVAGHHTYLIILLLIVLSILLTEFMSNVAAVAILLPIGLGVATEIPDISPLMAAMLIALSGGLAFMLVISTPGNTITYSSGYFSTRDLLRAGVVSNIVCIAIIFVIAIVYWKGVLGL
ncbi:MAG: DASS family sodium-coupled anion symporter [Candidatus Thermoplasmatota archaeon]|nr:DASS family sodium-coupled anion symporter [Candidatus Thermoplasmatota archaeon]